MWSPGPAPARLLEPGKCKGSSSARSVILVLVQESCQALPGAVGDLIVRTLLLANCLEGGRLVRIADQRLQQTCVVVIERKGPQQCQIDYNPCRPHIDFGRVVVDPDLRSAIIRCSTDQLFQWHLLLSARMEEASRLLRAHREAKVDQLDVPKRGDRWVRGEENILCLHVSVNHTPLVQVFEHREQLTANSRNTALGHNHLRVRQRSEQFTTADALQNEEEPPLLLEHIDEVHDVRMPETLQDGHFLTG
mmetsp:Transcript_37717/g.95477  ORF Transcript_37717/g.95477 Transcript_37717/m.95477 type:complete len:249 (+) Transcript_37717:728-1474(+)